MALPEIVCVIIVGRRGIMQKFAGPRLQRLVHCFPPLLCATVASCPDSLKQASVKVSVGTKLTALVDSGSSNSYISERIAKYLNLVVHSSTEDVSMALNSLKSHIVGHCYVDITLNKNVYPSCRLGILTDLCSDIILGQDFQGKNKSVVIKYGGSKLELIITKLTPLCALSAVQLEELYLFCFIIMVFNSLFDYIPLISFEIHWFFFILWKQTGEFHNYTSPNIGLHYMMQTAVLSMKLFGNLSITFLMPWHFPVMSCLHFHFQVI